MTSELDTNGLRGEHVPTHIHTYIHSHLAGSGVGSFAL